MTLPMYVCKLLAGSVALLFALSTTADAQRRRKRDPNAFPPVIINKEEKKKDEVTQVLPPMKEPPSVITADASRLSWATSPLSGKGLLSQQTRDALRSVLSSARGGAIVKIRAFVAGTGDVRRVQEIVSEVFTDRRAALPVLSVVQVGALPLESSQVVLEATVAERKAVNPHGLAFISGQRSSLADPVGPLHAAVNGASLDGTDVRRVTCYLSSLDGIAGIRQKVAEAFPQAELNFVQLLRGGVDQFAVCEAVAALKRAPLTSPTFFSTEPANFSQTVFVGPGRLALTSAQLAFHDSEADLRLAFERLGKALESAGASHKQIVFAHLYPLTRSVGERANKMRYEFHGAEATPAGTSLIFEGLPSLDATFALDVIAAF